MKILKLVILLACIYHAPTAQAAIWRVNNIAGMSADFTTLTAAHTAATAGDTLYIEASGTSYGNLTITKRLILIGPGYFQAQNYPTYPTNGLAIVGTLTFSSGSDGSIVYGLGGGTLFLNVSNILVSRNYNLNLTINSTNINILSNHNCVINASSISANALIQNNHLDYVITNSNPQLVFQNNIFEYTGVFFTFNKQVLRNNILVSNSSSGAISLSNCILTNNIDAISGGTRFGTTNGNFGNIDAANIFVGAAGISTDGQWRLKTGSPAIGAGLSGVDCGMYGGATPYILSGIPPGPAITKFSTSGQGSNTTPLQVSISVESKN
jgi:hypothetical protein